MTNKIFLKHQRKINAFFKNYQKQFKKMLAFTPDLQPFYKIILDHSWKQTSKISNTLLYFFAGENDINLKQKDNFENKYNYLLKAITLVALVIEKGCNTNIFNRDFEVKKNPYQLPAKFTQVSDIYYEKLFQANNQIYSFANVLYGLMKTSDNSCQFSDFLNLINNLILLIIIKEDMFIYKTLFGYKIKTKTIYLKEKTLAYLEVFKHVRKQLQWLFPNIFNNLIFVINSK